MEKKKIVLLFESPTGYDQGLLYGISRYVSERNHWRIHFYPFGGFTDSSLLNSGQKSSNTDSGSLITDTKTLKNILTDRKKNELDRILHWKPDGLIVRVSDPFVLSFFKKTGIPILDLGDEEESAGETVNGPSIRVDERALCDLAVSHFLERGIRNLSFYRYGQSKRMARRERHFEKTCAQYGLSFDAFHEDPEQSVQNRSPEFSELEKDRFFNWLKKQPKPFGIWAESDSTAVRLLDLFSQSDIRVPEEIGVLGTGNCLSLCSMADPTLSSIDTAPEKIGYQGAVLLDQRINHCQTDLVQTILIPPEGVTARKSTDFLTVDNPDAARIVHYIRMNAIYGITVADIQREFDMIPRTLQRLMKKSLGRTAEAEIRNVKIEYAKDLLTDPKLTMPQVAEQSGFPSAAGFVRVFKEKTGLTPVQFREKYSEKGISLFTPKFDRNQIRIKPLAERENDKNIRTDCVNPLLFPITLSDRARWDIDQTADQILRARDRGAARILAFGSHSIKDGLSRVLVRLMEGGWITHFAADGAGIIHDWEYAFQGETGENVRKYTAEGQFGIWDETGKYINAAIIIGAWQGLGYGESIGKMIEEEGINIPSDRDLLNDIISGTADEEGGGSADRAAAAADLLSAKRRFHLPDGFVRISHPYREFSLAHRARLNGIPFTCHPMFGYDVIYTHPMNKGAAIGRAAESDFLSFVDSVSKLDGGVYLSIGSSVMSPMVFGKALSMVRNISLRKGKAVNDFSIHVVDLLDSNWDWSQKKEPPANDPAYNLRFCRAFSQMGGSLNYCGADCRSWLVALLRKLENYD